MIEVLVCKDEQITKSLFNELGITFSKDKFCVRAMCGAEMLGYCLFSLDNEKEIIYCVEPANDRLLADGLLRSALHVGCERGIQEAFYDYPMNVELLKKINFLDDETEKRLKLQNLFTDCCCQENKNNQ